LGIFGGRRAQGINNNDLVKAVQMEAKKATPGDIWDEVGWHRGADRDWKFEIPDYNAEFTDLAKSMPSKPQYLKDILAHPELYNDYPDVGKIPVEFAKNMERDVFGSATMPNSRSPRGYITLNSQALQDEEALRRTLLHEIQHQVQARENFAQGGNIQPDLGKSRSTYNELLPLREKIQQVVKQGQGGPEHSDWLDNFSRYEKALQWQAWRDYADLAGEVEARNVSDRSRLRPYDLRNLVPTITEDVPREWQVVSRKPSYGTRE